MARQYPVPNYNFKVYIDSLEIGFSRITNIEDGIETEPIVEGGVNDFVYSAPKAYTQEKKIVFERGVIIPKSGKELVFAIDFRVGQRLPSSILIFTLGMNNQVTGVIEVRGCVVTKWSLGDLDAMNAQTFIERFEVTYEKILSVPNIFA